MKTRWLVVGATWAFAAACSLNPQPYPPDTNDGGFGADASAADATMQPNKDAGATSDAAPVPNDAGIDASDAETEAGDGAATDAAADGDAADDAQDDAPEDANA